MVLFFSDVYQMPSSADFERMRAEIASGVSASDVVFSFHVECFIITFVTVQVFCYGKNKIM